jgi:hypothetical protein
VTRNPDGHLSLSSQSCQDYITNTHTYYTPCPQAKLVNILLANGQSYRTPMPNTIVVPHWEEVVRPFATPDPIEQQELYHNAQSMPIHPL